MKLGQQSNDSQPIEATEEDPEQFNLFVQKSPVNSPARARSTGKNRQEMIPCRARSSKIRIKDVHAQK